MSSVGTFKNKNKQKFADFMKKVLLLEIEFVRRFQNFKHFTKIKIKTFKDKFIKFWSFINLPWCNMGSQKNWARSVQSFWRLMDTNKQTDKPNLYIHTVITRKLKQRKKTLKHLILLQSKLLNHLLSEMGLFTVYNLSLKSTAYSRVFWLTIVFTFFNLIIQYFYRFWFNFPTFSTKNR